MQPKMQKQRKKTQKEIKKKKEREEEGEEMEISSSRPRPRQIQAGDTGRGRAEPRSHRDPGRAATQFVARRTQVALRPRSLRDCLWSFLLLWCCLWSFLLLWWTPSLISSSSSSSSLSFFFFLSFCVFFRCFCILGYILAHWYFIFGLEIES